MKHDLFSHGRKAQIEQESPLANRMRPRTLDEYIGQSHIIGPGRLLRRAIEADQLSSIILYGPPGVGKTTLAMVIANRTQSHFITINAVLAGVKEIRGAIADAQERRNLYGKRTTLFVDEVHRWNKSQQDALLPHVERGTILLIGATTENPYFEVQKALVSRSRVFQLKPLTEDDLHQVIDQALALPDRGYGHKQVSIAPDAKQHLVSVSNGDARSVLNSLELAVETTPPNESGRIVIDLAVAEESIQKRAVLYDKDGDTHYDTISAFIKSLRGSDPDAALYWLAKMVYAGEDPAFIFRRMGIFTGEDIGMADPNAAVVVRSCWELFERIGMPEGRFPLANAAIYLATAPKSNSVFAFFDALAAVKQESESEVPNHLKDSNRDKEGFGHGKGYLYPHSYRNHWVAQQYLPTGLQGRLFYQPSDQGYERQIRDEVERKREAQLVAMLEQVNADQQPGEIFSTSPTNRQTDAWLARASAVRSGSLETIRTTLFGLAKIGRHHVVLDANVGNGLLLWEAVRQTPEGGVWGISPKADAQQILVSQAEALPEINRPTLITDPQMIPAEIRFDRIISRNRFTRLSDEWGKTFKWWGDTLLEDGGIVIAQVVPRLGQRLSGLIPAERWSDEALKAGVEAIETDIFTDPDDPLVCWSTEDFESQMIKSGFEIESSQIDRFAESRRIDAGELDRWFSDRGEKSARPSYKVRLERGGLSIADIEALETLYRGFLVGRPIDWVRHVLFVKAKKSK